MTTQLELDLAPPISVPELHGFAHTYIGTALWTTTQDDGRPLDDDYTIHDIHPDTLARMSADAMKFYSQNPECRRLVVTSAQDFWFTRNRHGAGFWDGDWPEPQATRLTEAAHRFGAYTLYVGDDGKVHGCQG